MADKALRAMREVPITKQMQYRTLEAYGEMAVEVTLPYQGALGGALIALPFWNTDKKKSDVEGYCLYHFKYGENDLQKLLRHCFFDRPPGGACAKAYVLPYSLLKRDEVLTSIEKIIAANVRLNLSEPLIIPSLK